MSPVMMMQMLMGSVSGISLQLLCWLCIVGVAAVSSVRPPAVSKESTPVALDPDQTSFAFTRSIELYTSGNESSDGIVRAERIRNWSRWHFEESVASDSQTSCFVRELLSRLELLDVGGGYFRVGQLMAQYKQYKQFLDCSEQEVNDLADKLERHSGLHDCDAIFRVFKESILEPAELLRKLFLLDPESASTVRSYMGSAIRQLNESVFEYCENKFYNDKRDIWCAARNYSIPEDKDFHRHIECIFNGLHYFNRGGDLDVDEICRDFHQVGITDLDNEVSEVLRSCDVNPETKALSYYRCLLESDFLDKFKEALDYREIRSADHFYALKDPMPVYDRNQIQSQINSVNRECCSI